MLLAFILYLAQGSSHWDSLPIAASLEAAYAGWPSEEGLSVPILKTKTEITDAGVSMNAVFCSPHKVAVQNIAYRNLFDSLHPDDNYKILSRRLSSILGAFCAEGWLDDVTPVLAKLKGYEAVQVLRTWSNSWSTSFRYHESRRLPCLLGCPGKPDCITHYACCPFIREYVSAAFGHSLFPECLDSLGTTARNPDALRQVACMYYAYHTVKFQPGICIIRTRDCTPCLHPDLDGDTNTVTSTTIEVNVALARSSFLGGLKAAAFTSGLNCPPQRSLPDVVGS